MKYFIFTILFLWVCPVSVRALTAIPPDCCQITEWTPQAGSGVEGNAVVASGSLFACDRTHDQLVVFSLASGAHTGSIPLPSGTHPYGVALGNDGYLYVGGYDGAVILKVAVTGGAAMTVAVGNGLIRSLAMDPANEDLYVTTESNGVRVLKKSAGYLYDGVVFSNTTGIPYTGIWVTPGGDVYLSGAGLVMKYKKTGSYSFSAPVTVEESPAVVNPFNITVDVLGRLYVASYGSAYYDVFNPSNGYNELNRCQLSDFPIGIAVDPSTGDVFLTGTNRVIKAGHCWSVPWITPTPSYQGADPPSEGQCFIYPSPARGNHAALSCLMAESGRVGIKIWNENGELAAQIDSLEPQGVQIVPFSLAKLATGFYFYAVTLQYDSGRSEKLKTRKFAVIH